MHASLGQEVRSADMGTFLGLLFGPLTSTESTTYLRAEMRPVAPSSSSSPAKLAPKSGGVVITLMLVAIFAPVIVAVLGHPPLEFHYDKIDPDLQVPGGHFGGATTASPSSPGRSSRATCSGRGRRR